MLITAIMLRKFVLADKIIKDSISSYINCSSDSGDDDDGSDDE